MADATSQRLRSNGRAGRIVAFVPIVASAAAGLAAAVDANSVDVSRWLVIVTFPLAVMWALADVAEQPDELWVRTGQHRRTWTFVVLFLGPIGVLAYYFVAHRQFEKSAP